MQESAFAKLIDEVSARRVVGFAFGIKHAGLFIARHDWHTPLSRPVTWYLRVDEKGDASRQEMTLAGFDPRVPASIARSLRILPWAILGGLLVMAIFVNEIRTQLVHCRAGESTLTTLDPKNGDKSLRIKALAERSSYVEKILRHALLAELSRVAWKRDPALMLQVFNAEVDAAGFDIVLGFGEQLRYVQLKQSSY